MQVCWTFYGILIIKNLNRDLLNPLILLDYDQRYLLVLDHFKPIKVPYNRFKNAPLWTYSGAKEFATHNPQTASEPKEHRKLHKNNLNSSPPPPAPQDAVSLEAWWNQSKHLSFHSFFKTARASFHYTRRWLSWWLYCDWKSESYGKIENSKISICRLHLINRN